VESRRHFAGFPPLHFSKDGGMPHFPDMPAQIKLTQRRGTTVINLSIAALIIAALYVGREIFVPGALAVLLSFVLAPFVIRMLSWRIPRTLSVLVVVFVGFSIIFSLGGLMVSQASRLAAALLLSANFGKDGSLQQIKVHVSQETLAEMIGTTRSRVSFFMKKFRKLGVISYNGKIEVHNSLLNAVLHDTPQIERD
jgi:predicted PurR-regulated permease PerM